MLGEGILETTTTTGTGDLTTSAVTGRPRITDFFTANATEASADIFYYSILTQDSPPQFLESGIGYMSATGTLVRATPLVTYSSGTLTKNSTSVSALSLAAGTKNVVVTALATSGFGLAIPGTDNSNSYLRYHQSAHLGLAAGTWSSTAAVTANRLYLQPFLNIQARVIDGVWWRLAGGSVSGNCRIGLYSCRRNGLPGRKIMGSTADTAGAASTLYVVTTGGPFLLPAGWYYLGFVADAGVSLNSTGSQIHLGCSPLGHDGSVSMPMHAYVTNGSTTLPDPCSALTAKVASTTYQMGVRVAA